MKALKNFILGASVQTTLSGYGTAAAIAGYNYFQSLNGQPLNYNALIVAIGIAVLGRFAKDHNVSNSPAPMSESKKV